MIRRTAGLVSVVGVLALAALPGVALAAPRPSVAVVSPSQGSHITGTSLTVHFAVHNFTLVAGTKSAVHAHGPSGHIQARLDNFPIHPATDITASTVHTWNGVPAGHHVLTIYLANTMNVPIPGVTPAKLSFSIAPRVTTPSVRPPRQTSAPGVGSGPRTGGADGAALPDANHNLMVMALFALILGSFLFVLRRFTFGLAGARAGQPVPASSMGSPVVPPPSVPVVLSASPVAPDSGRSASAASAVGLVESGRPDLESRDASDGQSGAVRGIAADAESDTGPQPQPEAHDVRRNDDTAHPVEDAALADVLEAARRWPDVVSQLAERIERDAQERVQLQDRIAALEETLRRAQAWRSALAAAGSDPLSPDDLSQLRYVAAELLRDPDHIVTLGAVSQHATKVNQVVEEYARLHEALYRSGHGG